MQILNFANKPEVIACWPNYLKNILILITLYAKILKNKAITMMRGKSPRSDVEMTKKTKFCNGMCRSCATIHSIMDKKTSLFYVKINTVEIHQNEYK